MCLRTIYVVIVLLCDIIGVRSLPPYEPPYTVLLHTDEAYVQHGDEGELFVMCLKNLTLAEAIPPLKNIDRPVTSISVYNCVPPNTSYIDAFETLNIPTKDIRKMGIVFKDKRPLPPGKYMEKLNLNYLALRITNDEFVNLFQNATDFLRPLSNVTELFVNGLRIPELPVRMGVKKLRLSGDTHLDQWGGCKDLEALTLNNVANVPIWPQECISIKEISMDSMPNANGVFKNMIGAAPYVTKVEAKYSSIHSLPVEFLAAASRLEHLDLSNNELYDNVFVPFPLMTSLKTLDLSENLINGGFLKYVVPNVPGLHSLYAKYITNFQGKCSADFGDFREGLEHLQRSSFREVSFFGSETDLNCFNNAHYKNLSFLEIGNNEADKLKLMNLPTSDADELTINFYFTYFDEIIFTQADYEALRKSKQNASRNLTVLKIRYVNCDCAHGWLRRALKDLPDLVQIPGLTCNEKPGREILDEPEELLECEKWTEKGCLLKRSWGAKVVDARCQKQALPSFSHPLHGLNVSNNGLTTFYSELPSTVKWIDYRYNQLSSANATAVEELFKNGRRVWLGNNQIICDCGNSLLLNAILEHSTQVEDYHNLTCIGSGEPISSVSTAILCQTALKASLAILVLIAGVFVMLLLVFRRYADEIKMFLYARGWCLSWLSLQDLEDKPYDAFISYAHGDEEYVQTLLAGLEDAEEKYRICIHYRDWELGEWIPASIIASVKQSKRTILVLSRSFVNSSWSSLEFRYAKAMAAQDKRCRLLIIVIDDVLTADVHPELKAYVSNNTYLTSDDRWFWQKLKYAMPHRTKSKIGRKDDGEKLTRTKRVNISESVNESKVNVDDSGNIVVTFPENSTSSMLNSGDRLI